MIRTAKYLFPSLVFAVSFSAIVACSGGGGGGGTDAAPAKADASTGPVASPDAAPATSADGKACTPTQMDPKGGCPATHVCLQNGCAEECSLTTMAPIQANGAPCTGYQGPGASACIISISPGQGQDPTTAACLIFCEDTSGMVPGCRAPGACDGQCPNGLTCGVNAMLPAGVKVCQ